MQEGDIVGAEPMGIVEEVGSGVEQIKARATVVISVGDPAAARTRTATRSASTYLPTPAGPSEVPQMYETYRNGEDGCMKVVLES